MLIVKDIAQFSKPTLDLESLVLALNWDAGNSDIPLYWRTGNFHRSLIEIGINENDGKLISFTLVIADGMSPLTEIPSFLQQVITPINYGIPVFDISRWPQLNAYKDHFIDEPETVTVYIGESQLSILFGEVTSIQYRIVADKVTFGVDKKNTLLIVEVAALSDLEIKNLKQIFHYHS